MNKRTSVCIHETILNLNENEDENSDIIKPGSRHEQLNIVNVKRVSVWWYLYVLSSIFDAQFMRS